MTVRLEAGAGTVHWGYLDATLPAVAAVDSGDVVTISTVSGPPEALPPPPANVPQALHDIHNSKARRMLLNSPARSKPHCGVCWRPFQGSPHGIFVPSHYVITPVSSLA